MVTIELKTALDTVILICLFYLLNKRIEYYCSVKSDEDTEAHDRLEGIILFASFASVLLLFAHLVWKFGLYFSWWK